VSIDLNDNLLRGEVPPELGSLSNLSRLRLSYNLLTGLPTTLANLKNLSFLHIHGNRIGGNDDFINLVPDPTIDLQFVADCGDPTDSLEPFVCKSCDMCCNSFEECQVPLQSSSRTGFYDVAVVLGILLLAGVLLWFLSAQMKSFPPSETNAKEACGEGVYGCV